MKMATQRRLQLPLYPSSSKDIESEQTAIPEFMSALKEKIEKEVEVSTHKSRFIRKKEDSQHITTEEVEMMSASQKQKRK